MYRSKVDLRLEAARIASTCKDVDSNNIVDVANSIYSFVIGNADVPEIVPDMMAMFKELTEKMAEQSKISADSLSAISTAQG